MVIKMARKLIYGVGFNDADYPVTTGEGRNRRTCPFYLRWASMLRRCYSVSHKKKYPTYSECTTCEEWLIFSNFKSWMEQQDWKGKHLDKDILFKENKTYSPEACVFISPETNMLTTDSSAIRGEWPIGVSWHKHEMKFRSGCSNPFTKKIEHLGYFSNPEQAHQAWRKRKHELACEIASLQEDARVAAALMTRYLV